ncbi:MAG TPA: hypothetical protein VK694_01645 [Verrucomicrobiae bacterium]|nr:hypothetical protein [Verrucomicrobiae bacterium]
MFTITNVRCPGTLKHIAEQVLASDEWRPFFTDDERRSILDQLTGGDFEGRVMSIVLQHCDADQVVVPQAIMTRLVQLNRLLQGYGDTMELLTHVARLTLDYDYELARELLAIGRPGPQIKAINDINARVAEVTAYTDGIARTAKRLIDDEDTWFPLFDDEDTAFTALLDLRTPVLSLRVQAIEAINVVLAANADALAFQREAIAYVHAIRREAQELIDTEAVWLPLFDDPTAAEILADLYWLDPDLTRQVKAIGRVRAVLAQVVLMPDGTSVPAPAWLAKVREVA